MRLHRLQLEAFGPFASAQEVDFDQVADAGLFLLHGATGAGKTSILDAVCFALYGQVPGARAAGRPRLRSDHAAEGVAPQVVLELTVGGRRLEVTRSPEWQRPKKRGGGTTRQPAVVHLRELLDGCWQPLTVRRSDEAALLLQDLLGMGIEQFTKVVLLPQGEFAAFLRAGAQERAELLGRLFDIERFTGAERWLREERQRLAGQVQEADAERAQLVARAREAAQFVDGDVSASDELALADPDGQEVVRALARVAATKAEQASAAVVAARARCEAARQALAAASDLHRGLSRRRELLEQLSALEADDQQHRAQVERLETARRASRLQLPLRGFDEAKAAVRAAADQVAAADLAATELGVPAASTDVEQLRTALAGLDSARSIETDLAQARSRRQVLAADSDQARLDLEAAAEQAVRAQQLVSQAAKALDEHGPTAALAATASGRLETAQARLAAAREVAVLTEEQGRLESDRLAAHEQQLSSREHWLDVRERRLAGMSAELAAQLEAGQPCTVCGSREHAQPARPLDDHVDELTEQRAERQHRRDVDVEQRLTQQLADLTARRAAREQASAGRDVVTAQDAVSAAGQQLAETAAAAEVVAVAEQSREAGQRALLEARGRRQEAEQRLAAATSAIGELEPRIGRLQQRIDELLEGEPDLDTRQGRLRGQLDALIEAQRAAAALMSARDHQEALRASLAEAAAGLGFASIDAARAGCVDEDSLDHLEATLAAQAEQRSRLEALLGAPELAQLPDDGRVDWPDVTAVDAVSRAAERELSTCSDRLAVTSTAQASLHSLAGQLDEHDDVHRDLRAGARAVDDLSRCVDGTGGGNALRMRLSSYVLAARLEEVAAAASERLQVMSEGRFTLSHTDDLARSGARSGLGLLVVDEWTGVARETSTLSGGESFLASLALALGLADVVQAESGGATIETLFVDEGFGTLDHDTLDDVMAVLDGLRDGGRTVGIVSHVSELRDRVPTCIEVHKSRTGSLVLQAVDAAGRVARVS